jgi:hypothetical protein
MVSFEPKLVLEKCSFQQFLNPLLDDIFEVKNFFYQIKKTGAAARLFRCNDNNNKRFERIVYCTMTCKTLQNKKTGNF